MSEPIKNIFIPVNFAASADHAIYAGISMCKRHGANLHLLYIERESTLIHPPGRMPGAALTLLKGEMERAAELENRARKIQEESKVTCFFHTGKGNFHEVLAKKTCDFYCDLIIIQKPASILSFSLKRHSAYKVLKYANCPVLIIPTGKWASYFKNIFFPVRPIQSGIQKLEIALPIIKKNRADVSLFAALKNLSEMGIAANFIQKADNLLSKNNIKVETEINSSDDIAKQVVKRAIEKDSDLIIISATIKGGFASLFSRNYTEKVIDSSPIPVLSVKVT